MYPPEKVHYFDSKIKKEVICICGDSGSGKSTIAKYIQNSIPNTIVLDGDSIRYYVNTELSFTLEDRIKNNKIIAGIATILYNQGFNVVISTIRSDLAYKYLQKNNINCRLFKLSSQCQNLIK